jgi:hypothetical protein
VNSEYCNIFIHFPGFEFFPTDFLGRAWELGSTEAEAPAAEAASGRLRQAAALRRLRHVVSAWVGTDGVLTLHSTNIAMENQPFIPFIIDDLPNLPIKRY